MIETKLSVKEIERIIVSYLGGVRTNLIVPNLSWGFLNHEADLISIDKNGYLTEVEIKRSLEDFKADFKKENYHDTDERVYRFGYFPKESKGDLFNLTLLICMSNGRMFPAYYDIKENIFADEFNEVIEIAYWMEIPKLPTE